MTNFRSYFDSKGTSYIPVSDGKELRIVCPWCQNPDRKCYVENRTGRFFCFQCDSKGGWQHLLHKLGDPNINFAPGPVEPDEGEFDPPPFDPRQVEDWHRELLQGTGKQILPEYLYTKRGYTEETVKKFKLGWNGRSVAIPILNALGECLNFKLKKDPTLPIPPKGMYSVRGWGKRRLFNEAVLNQPQDSIIISEGEWDCMLLDQNGYPAVTSTAGASTFDRNWVQGFAKCKKIYLCYDQDRNQAGQDGAAKTAKIFHEFGVTVYRVNLPEPEAYWEKIDITDYFTRLGKTKEDFDQLLEAATPLTPVEDSKGSTQGILIPSATEFLQQDFGETPWLVEDLIPIGGSAIFVAKRESYKTWLALYMANCITKGLSLWDKFATTKSSVLYISNDDPAAKFLERMRQFSFGGDFFVYHQRLPNFSVDHDNGSFTAVKSLIREKGIGSVFVDILRNTHSKDSNTDKDAKEVIEKYKELREGNPDLVFIFLIHPPKENAFEKRFNKRESEEAVGSYYWEATVDTVFSLTKTVDEELTHSVVISITKNKQSDKRFKPFIGIKGKEGSPVEFVYEEKIPEKLKTELAKEAILQYLGEQPLKRQEIFDRLTVEGIASKRTGETALGALQEEEKIDHSKSRPYTFFLINSTKETSPQTASIYKDYGVAESDNESAHDATTPEQPEFDITREGVK